jgi:hypothetical protein
LQPLYAQYLERVHPRHQAAPHTPRPTELEYYSKCSWGIPA